MNFKKSIFNFSFIIIINILLVTVIFVTANSSVQILENEDENTDFRFIGNSDPVSFDIK